MMQDSPQARELESASLAAAQFLAENEAALYRALGVGMAVGPPLTAQEAGELHIELVDVMDRWRKATDDFLTTVRTAYPYAPNERE